jgi:hypothetical protein
VEVRIIGLFIVVFGCVAANKALGFNDTAMIIGVIVGAGSYITLSAK